MPSIALTRLIRHAYRLNLLDARQVLANRFTGCFESKRRKEKKIDAPLEERDATRHDEGEAIKKKGK